MTAKLDGRWEELTSDLACPKYCPSSTPFQANEIFDKLVLINVSKGQQVIYLLVSSMCFPIYRIQLSDAESATLHCLTT